MGRNGNGWYGWKDKDGQNLHELERQ
jgi:hypothetical protein